MTCWRPCATAPAGALRVHLSSMITGTSCRAPSPRTPQGPQGDLRGMKLCVETLTKVYARRYGIPYNIVQASAVFGPSDNNRRVLQIFVENAFRGRPCASPTRRPASTSPTSRTRPGLHRHTFSKAATRPSTSRAGSPPAWARPAQAVKRRFPDLVVEERIKTDTYRPERGALDIAKARALAGYDPKYDVESGLNEYVDYMRPYNRPSRKEIAWKPSPSSAWPEYAAAERRCCPSSIGCCAPARCCRGGGEGLRRRAGRLLRPRPRRGRGLLPRRPVLRPGAAGEGPATRSCPGLHFRGLASCIVRAGATPVFCDVDRWGTMDLDKAQALGTPASRP